MWDELWRISGLLAKLKSSKEQGRTSAVKVFAGLAFIKQENTAAV